MEKVSIIVPVYNAQKYIGRCVESILAQDYENIEVILVDDGSKDELGRILDDFAADSRVKVIHKPNGGVSSTRNRGIAEATGKYLQFVDADDCLTPEATKLMVRSIEEDDSDMVVCDFYRVVGDAQSKKGSISRSGCISRREYADEMLRTPADLYYGVLWNKLYRRDVVKEHHIVMDENISYCEDMIFNLEYLLHAEKISVLTVPIYYYYMTPGSLVEQGTNIPGIIEMKTNVIGYYSKFYKDILSPMDYMERLPVIYGYLIAISTDSLAFNLFSRRNRIEKTAVLPVGQSLLLNSYLAQSLIERYLNTLGQKYSLDLREGKLLYFMQLSHRPLSISQLSDMTGYSTVQVVVSVGKLLSMKYIQREHVHTLDAFSELFTIANEKLKKDMDYIEQDCMRIVYKDMTEEEAARYRELQERINANIISALSE